MLKAVIFDMDGVLVDSEPMWRIVMIKGFCSVGLNFTEADCRKTTGMRLDEVIEHWHKLTPWDSKSNKELHDEIIDDLCAMIMDKGVAMNGAIEAIEYFAKKNFKIGLASSSNNKLIATVIKKLGVEKYFESINSAEHLAYGKPHPQVFLDCANDLGIKPEECLVIEDSVNGVIAAKAAKMKAVAVPDAEHCNDKRFAIADVCLTSLLEMNDSILEKLN